MPWHTFLLTVHDVTTALSFITNCTETEWISVMSVHEVSVTYTTATDGRRDSAYCRSVFRLPLAYHPTLEKILMLAKITMRLSLPILTFTGRLEWRGNTGKCNGRGMWRGSIHACSANRSCRIKIKIFIFGRVSKSAKSDCWLRHVCVCPSARKPVDRFSWNLIFEYFSKFMSRKFKIR